MTGTILVSFDGLSAVHKPFVQVPLPLVAQSAYSIGNSRFICLFGLQEPHTMKYGEGWTAAI